MTSARAGRVISVGGGRGAGKSTVAANLAVALAQAGAQVALVDADAPGQHGLFGLGRPAPAAPSPGAAPDLTAAAVESGLPGLRLVALGGPATGDGSRLLRELRALDAEIGVVDVGAGEPSELLERFDAADLRLVVTTPDLSSATDAYALLAGVVRRELLRGAAALGRLGRVEAALERAGAGAGAAELLAGLAREDAALAAGLQARLAGLGVRVVGNLLLTVRETALVYALSRMAREFLGVEAPVLASLRATRRIQRSVTEGRPYLLCADADGEDGAATFRTMAQALRAAAPPRAPDAPGGGDAPAAPPARALALPTALPVDVTAYEQGYQRHLVALPATLIQPGGRRPALLLDVSEGGALCELDQPPPAGTEVTLVVPGLPDLAGVGCEVRHAAPGKRRAGLQFRLPRDEGRRVALAIRLLGADRLRGVPGAEGLVR